MFAAPGVGVEVGLGVFLASFIDEDVEPRAVLDVEIELTVTEPGCVFCDECDDWDEWDS